MKSTQIIKIMILLCLLDSSLNAAVGTQRSDRTRQTKKKVVFVEEPTQLKKPHSRPQQGGVQKPRVTKAGKKRTKERTKTPAKPGPTPKQLQRGRTSLRPGTTTQQTGKPKEINELLWSTLSEKMSKEEQAEFIAANEKFINTVAKLDNTDDEHYALWKNLVVSEAKKIIAIKPAVKELTDYCIRTIRKELEAAPEERGIVAANEMPSIEKSLRDYEQSLKEYLPEELLTTGTTLEQFNNLMKTVPQTREGKPTDKWLEEVERRARTLVLDKQLTIEEVRNKMNANLPKSMNGDINRIVGSVAQYAKQVEIENSPEHIEAEFRKLLLTVDSQKYWDNANKQPTEEWIKAIVREARKALQIINVPLEEIKNQIGAEVYFVAVKKAGGDLKNKAAEDKILSVIDSIFRRIESK